MAEVGSIILIGVVFSFMFTLYVVSMGEGASWSDCPSGDCAQSLDAAGGETGWNRFKTEFTYNLPSTAVNALLTPLGALGGLLALGSVTVFPNPYALFAGFTLYLSGFINLVAGTVLPLLALPGYINDFATVLIYLVGFLGAVAWLKGGGII